MASYKLVPEHNGIEIYFDQKPSVSICEELKSNGWRWHTAKKCWFAKNTAESKAFAQRLCGITKKTASMKSIPIEISVSQNIGSRQVSTLTISPAVQGYNVSSTNNQIICCDCNRFFSIHAAACPFCGCPLHFVANHYYEKYSSEIVREQGQMQKKQQDIVDKQYKEQTIRKLKRARNHSPWRNFDVLMNLNIDAFEKAIARDQYLIDNSELFPYIDNDTWYKLLIADDATYSKSIQMLAAERKENMAREQIFQKANEGQRKINALKIEMLCKKYNLALDKSAIEPLSSYSSDEIQARIDAINYYAGIYPELQLTPESHIYLSVDMLKEYIKEKLGTETI